MDDPSITKFIPQGVPTTIGFIAGNFMFSQRFSTSENPIVVGSFFSRIVGERVPHVTRIIYPLLFSIDDPEQFGLLFTQKFTS